MPPALSIEFMCLPCLFQVSSIRLPSGPCNAFSLCASRVGPVVALACADHSVRLMRVELGRTVWTASALKREQLPQPDGEAMSTAAEKEQRVQVRDPVAESALAITCADGLLAVGTHQGRVLVLDSHSGLLARSIVSIVEAAYFALLIPLKRKSRFKPIE